MKLKFPVFIFLFAAFTLVITLPDLLFAEDGKVRAQDIKIYTPVYQPSLKDFEPPLGTYTYKVAWQGISAADVNVTVERIADQYKIITTAKTYSGIDLFYRLRYKAEGLISAIDLTPIKTSINHKENSRHKITKITFEKDGGIHASRYRKGDREESDKLSFNPKNFTLDPISASFLARGVDWKVGDSRQFDTFNGRSRYLITLTAKAKKNIHISGTVREAWEIVPRIQNLTNPKNNKKFRAATIYLSTDRSREILQIISSVFIGRVATTMVNFEPSVTSPENKNGDSLRFVSAKRSREEANL